ncbi:MAG TPA: DNA translocase FtsK [Nitrospinaceae bacterium]|nr:DNA translocase FtsK [Nitrospinaceae bacterium]
MNEKVPILIRDFLGIATLAFSLFAIVSLVTYSPADPSMNTSFSSQAAVTNSGGLVGAYISDGLAQLFGSGAFFFPLITLIMGWALIRGKEFHHWPLRLGSGIFLLIGLCALCSVQFNTDPVFKNSVQVGGLTGETLGRFLVIWFSTIGATIFLVTLVFASLLAMTGTNVNSMLELAAKLAGTYAGKLFQLISKVKTKCNEWIAIARESAKASKAAKIKSEEVFEPTEPIIVTRERLTEPEPVQAPTIIPQKKKSKEEFIVNEGSISVSEDGDYKIPPISLLDDSLPVEESAEMKEEILLSSSILERKLADFGVEGKVVQVLPGPVITLYEFEPAPGIKVSRILSLSDDLALAMRALSLRILAPVPGKPVVGIEIPNTRKEVVSFKEVITSKGFAKADSKLMMVIGKDSIGEPMVQDLATIPHLLMAGSTGSGKSVGLNAMISSILLNATPDEVKMIMIDPKMLELSIFDGIPHLISPVVTNPKKAAAALAWAVQEMENRYKLMAELGVRNITGFNLRMDKLRNEYEEELEQWEKDHAKGIKPHEMDPDELMDEEDDKPIEPQAKLPYIVIVIDELADLMMVASKGVEEALTRLAQMARASGIHLIVATQRPSVDVLTGIIKANFPSRISYKVTSRVDSRTILDSMGAEKLLGRGDMLFMPPGTHRLLRIHGAMVSDDEIERIIKFIKEQKKPDYIEEIFSSVVVEDEKTEEAEDYDEKYDEALALVARDRQASISYIQRRLRIGYNRAARIIETMERDGVVGPSDGVRPREIYVNPISVE